MSEYVPGACNIGSREIMRRRAVGIAALVFTLISGYTLLAADDLTRAARWGIFFPLFVSAIGFIQARNKFCMAYGLAGTFNLEKLATWSASSMRKARRLIDAKHYQLWCSPP